MVHIGVPMGYGTNWCISPLECSARTVKKYCRISGISYAKINSNKEFLVMSWSSLTKDEMSKEQRLWVDAVDHVGSWFLSEQLMPKS